MSNLIINIYSFRFPFILADSAPGNEAIPQFLQDIIGEDPLLEWLFGSFTVLSLVIATVIAITGNLQSIIEVIDFFKTTFLGKESEVIDAKPQRLRNQLLTRLKNDNSIRRQNSLHNLIQIDLAMEEQRHQVGRITTESVSEELKKKELVSEDVENKNIFKRVVQFFNRKTKQTTNLKANQKIIEFFDRDDIQGKLLILGEPGAGKTTELLSLTEDLIQRAIQDNNAPIPIIFELSSWKNDQPIREWLVEKLTEIYKGIPTKIAEEWIDTQEVIPLFDGLDELGLEQQNKCMVVLNQFFANNFQSGVVCCRREEYEQAEIQLEHLNGSIYLQSLSDEQIKRYLKSLNRLNIWDKTIVNEPSLLELVRVPLFLTMLVVAYQGRAIRNSSELFEAYIAQQLNNSDNQGIYPPNKSPSQKQTLHYLVWLARKLEAEKETEFLIEGMQPKWLESTKQKNAYGIIFRLIGGLIGLPLAWSFAWSLVVFEKTNFETTFIFILIIMSLFMFICGFSIFIHYVALFHKKIKPVEKINVSFNKAFNYYKNKWIYHLPAFLAILLFGWYFWYTTKYNISFYVITGIFLAFIFFLAGGFSTSELENKHSPNQGIWNSLKNGLIFLLSGFILGLILGMIIGLTDPLNLLHWLVFGLLFGLLLGPGLGLVCGLGCVIQHFSLRFLLYQNNNIPWNYAQFLDHAAKHRFIQRVGGRYRFMHDLLRKHFAQMRLN